MAVFRNNMFEDFDMSGIMNPEITNVMNLRKDANNSRNMATDQYEADIADFKNIQATEAEQGIASLPNAPFTGKDLDSNWLPPQYWGDQDTTPTTAQNYFNPTLFGYDVNLPDNITAEDFQFEDVDLTGYVPDFDNPVFTNPYVDVFTNPNFVDTTFTNLPDLGVMGMTDGFSDIVDVGMTDGSSDIVDVDVPLPDYPFVDPETGGDIVLAPGTPTNPGPGVVITDPDTGDLPPGHVIGGGGGPAGTIIHGPFIPPPPSPPPLVRRPYETVIPYERPLDDVMAGYTQPMDPSVFGSTPGFESPRDDLPGIDPPVYAPPPFPGPNPPGMKSGGRVPMGNNNMLNSGLSRLPLNQQNDTLTQVFQSGFKPRKKNYG